MLLRRRIASFIGDQSAKVWQSEEKGRRVFNNVTKFSFEPKWDNFTVGLHSSLNLLQLILSFECFCFSRIYPIYASLCMHA